MISLSAFKGITNKSSANRTPAGYLRECVDFVVSNSGMLAQRYGYELKLSGLFDCLWGDNNRCFAVLSGDLVEIIEAGNGYEANLLRANIGASRLYFTECGGNYYFVSSAVTGVIRGWTVLSFGQEQVTRQPTLTAVTGGDLLAGTYLVAVTFLDDNGVESGTCQASSVNVPVNGMAIQLSNWLVPSDRRSTFYAVYVSTLNGNQLYRQGVLPISVPLLTIPSVDNSGLLLSSIGVFPAPRGQGIAYHYGHLFIASGKSLFYSEKFQYERFSPFNRYDYAGEITAIMPCHDGLWIAADNLYWISGRQPSHGKDAPGDFIQVKKHSDGFYFQSVQKVEPEFISDGTGDYGWLGMNDDGIFLLKNGGEMLDVTQDIINLPDCEIATSAVLQHDDGYYYLAIMRGNLNNRTI